MYQSSSFSIRWIVNKGFDVVLTSSLSFDLAIIISLVKYTVNSCLSFLEKKSSHACMIQTKKKSLHFWLMHDSVLHGKFRVKCWQLREEKYNLGRASDRVRKKFGNYAALLSLTMRQERSIMRQIMRFHFSQFNLVLLGQRGAQSIFCCSRSN